MLYLTSDKPPTAVIQGGCADAAGSVCVAEAVQQVASGHVPAAHHAGMVSAHNLQHGCHSKSWALLCITVAPGR